MPHGNRVDRDPARSYERLGKSDLVRLGRAAHAELDAFFARNPHLAGWRDRVRIIALAQGGACPAQLPQATGCAPQPGAPSFVEEGQPVAAGQTLCILEAMKLMNEVKAEVEGIVRTIHVENAEPVEYGQLLFELEPVGGRPLDAI